MRTFARGTFVAFETSRLADVVSFREDHEIAMRFYNVRRPYPTKSAFFLVDSAMCSQNVVESLESLENLRHSMKPMREINETFSR